MEVNLFIPTGYCGYWNLQKTSTPGQEWAFQIMFDVTGIASADAGASAAFTFPFSFDTWINMELVVDLNADWCEIWVDGVMLYEYQWTLGTFGTPGLLQFGGVNIKGEANLTQPTDIPMFYMDDVVLSELQAVTGFNVYLDGVFVASVSDYITEFTYEGLIGGQTYIAGVSAVYDEGESTFGEFSFIYNPDPIFDPPSDVAVDEVTGTVSWSAPVTPNYWLDNMDSYVAGQYLALQSDDWTTWSGTPGGADDGYVVDELAFSGSNSLKVEGSTTDLVH